eukprot:5453564-Pyramimonas_sp.AAC.1
MSLRTLQQLYRDHIKCAVLLPLWCQAGVHGCQSADELALQPAAGTPGVMAVEAGMTDEQARDLFNKYRHYK